MNHERLKRLQNLPVFVIHPRVALVDEIALHSHSPLHQRYLSGERCFHFLSLIGFKREKGSNDDSGLSTYPLPSGHSPHEVAVWPPQFTNSPPDPIVQCAHCSCEKEIDRPCSPSCTIGSTAFVLLGASVAPEIVFGSVVSSL